MKRGSDSDLITFAELCIRLNISKMTLWRKIQPIKSQLQFNGTRKRLYSPKEVDLVTRHVNESL